VIWNRGVKLTDDGLVELVNACRDLEELYLYAVPKYVSFPSNSKYLYDVSQIFR
jgi:hypothetical protein